MSSMDKANLYISIGNANNQCILFLQFAAESRVRHHTLSWSLPYWFDTEEAGGGGFFVLFEVCNHKDYMDGMICEVVLLDIR